MKNILIPTDFSLAAWNATEFALRLFANTTCTFYFLNAYTPEIYSNRLMAGNAVVEAKVCTAQKASEKGLSMLLSRVKKQYGNHCHTYVKIPTFSLLIEEVKEAIEKYALDFIVMGATGEEEDPSCLMGRNAVRILDSVQNCPVLVIPKKFTFRDLANIALVSDANYFYKGNELNSLLEVCSGFNSRVHILNFQKSNDHLNTLKKLNLYTIDKTLHNVSHEFYNISVKDALSFTLSTFIDQNNCQLVVVFSSNHEFMKNLRLNYVIDKAHFCKDVPILSLKSIEN